MVFVQSFWKNQNLFKCCFSFQLRHSLRSCAGLNLTANLFLSLQPEWSAIITLENSTASRTKLTPNQSISATKHTLRWELEIVFKFLYVFLKNQNDCKLNLIFLSAQFFKSYTKNVRKPFLLNLCLQIKYCKKGNLLVLKVYVAWPK